MADSPGEKTEQATQRHLDEAWKQGQFARSPEVQTVFVLVGGMTALLFGGQEVWQTLVRSMVSMLSHLHDFPLAAKDMQRHAITSLQVFLSTVWPVLSATAVAGLLAGGMQSRFQATPEALGFKWERLDPMSGFSRVFSARSAVPSAVGAMKLSVVVALSWGVIQGILADPIFYTAVDIARIGSFLWDASWRIVMRVGFALGVLAAADYGYQLWRTQQDLMMTKEEVKEEHKNQEGDPKVKQAMRRRRQAQSKRKQLAEVPKADVVLTNPTHLAVALRYDKKAMKAPIVVAKGSRLNALRIREIAKQHQIPIIENKPLARMLFKYSRVGGEIPAQLYSAVAEILAYVYRINAYRYYREQHS